MGPELAPAVGLLGPFRPPKKITQSGPDKKQKHFFAHVCCTWTAFRCSMHLNKKKNVFLHMYMACIFACMCHAHRMHALCDSGEKKCACTTTIPFICNLVDCSVMRNNQVIVNYCVTCHVHVIAKLCTCAHLKLTYLSFSTLSTILWWNIDELL